MSWLSPVCITRGKEVFFTYSYIRSLLPVFIHVSKHHVETAIWIRTPTLKSRFNMLTASIGLRSHRCGRYKSSYNCKKHIFDLSVSEYNFCVHNYLFPPMKLLCVFNQSDDVTLSRTGATSGAAQSGQPMTWSFG